MVVAPGERGGAGSEIARTAFGCLGTCVARDAEAGEQGAGVEVKGGDIARIGEEDGFLSWWAEMARCQKRKQGGGVGVLQSRTEVRKSIGAGDHVPNTHLLVMTDGDEIFSIICPSEAVHSTIMCAASLPPASTSSFPIVADDADRVFQIQNS